jgi:hypothetical protein
MQPVGLIHSDVNAVATPPQTWNPNEIGTADPAQRQAFKRSPRMSFQKWRRKRRTDAFSDGNHNIPTPLDAMVTEGHPGEKKRQLKKKHQAKPRGRGRRIQNARATGASG